MTTNKGKYDVLDDEPFSDSVDETLLESGSRRKALQSTWSKPFTYKRGFWCMAVISCTFLGLWIAQRHLDRRPLLRSDTQFPRFDSERVTFGKGAAFEHSLAMESGSPWKSLLPPKTYGFVTVTDPRHYNVSGGMPLDLRTNTKMPEKYKTSGSNPDDTEVYVMSVFHQLHCLMMMRDTFMTKDSSGKIVAGMMDTDAISNGHLNHCFDYLRQAIMCAGDTALDRYSFDESGPELVYGVNGWGTTHQCRDFDAIYDYAAEKGWKRGYHPDNV